MIGIDTYVNMLSLGGNNISEVHKNESDMVMNLTFRRDVGYKRVYILTKDGWKYTDAKYSKHATPSILRDKVDRYLQFRPKEHYPIGTYVFIPNDTSPSLGFSEESPEDPFLDDGFDLNKLWMIVERDDETQFVRYNILQCNWDLRWIYKIGGESLIKHCYCAARNASSYTSGIWLDFRVTGLDQITTVWIPDTNLLYGDKLKEFSFDDTRTIMHGERMMITTNVLDPKCYMVSKIVDINPQGMLKITLKQDEFDPKRDNTDLMICDYYDDSGDIQHDEKQPDYIDDTKTSKIVWMYINEDNELISREEGYSEVLAIGNTYYFTVDFSDEFISPQWRITLQDDDGKFTETEKARLERLMVLKKLDDSTASIKVSKAASLYGKTFILSVADMDGQYYSSIEVEVQNET